MLKVHSAHDYTDLFLEVDQFAQVALGRSRTSLKSITSRMHGRVATKSIKMSNASGCNRPPTGLMTWTCSRFSHVNQSRCPHRGHGASPAGSEGSILRSKPQIEQ